MFTNSSSKSTRPAVLVTSLVMAATLFASACGGSTTEAALDGATSPDSTAAEDAVIGALFDATMVHSISVSVDDTTFSDMLSVYITSGDKEWIEATVTIDGSTYEQVGIKLKGNSSLRGVSTDASPEDLPWLIRLDKYVDDQNHEGYVDLVVRSNNTTTALNEAVALELLGDAGLATEKAMEIGFSVNGSDAVLRLVVEHPDDVWMADNFSADGALYKAESGGDYSYRGDDPEAYDDIFDQEAGKDNADLTPLIGFLDFINNADDETFASELSDRLDVESFATYLAMMDLVDNFDDIDGPGNNSYLYYDTETEQFTVVPWDLNLAFGIMTEGGGGFGGPPAGAPAVGQRPEGGLPAGGEFGQRPEGGPPADGGFGRPGGSNILVERFKANTEFNSLYTAALEQLDAELFASGHAQEVLDQWTAVLETTPDLVDVTTVSTEASVIETYLA